MSQAQVGHPTLLIVSALVTVLMAFHLLAVPHLQSYLFQAIPGEHYNIFVRKDRSDLCSVYISLPGQTQGPQARTSVGPCPFLNRIP